MTDLHSLSTPELKSQLVGLVRALSYLEGDFTLTSGLKSDHFIDLKTTSLHPEGAALIGELIYRTVTEGGDSPAGVGGLTLGADPLATTTSLAAWSHGVSWPAFLVRKESKGHGPDEYLEGKANLTPGAKVVVLEDVTSTGGSSLKAVERVQAEGFEVSAVLTVVDREMGGRSKVEEAGVPFIALITVSEIQG